MTAPAASTALDALRGRVRALELGAPGAAGVIEAVSPGVAALDGALPWGGLPRGALHEVAGGGVVGGDAAEGFSAALAARLIDGRGPALWCLARGDLHGPGPCTQRSRSSVGDGGGAALGPPGRRVGRAARARSDRRAPAAARRARRRRRLPGAARGAERDERRGDPLARRRRAEPAAGRPARPWCCALAGRVGALPRRCAAGVVVGVER